ncbi:MAG TPA: hypothetical protein VJ875_09420 [Pyrinomonadaceae bacterium]|nr:hypothetical protein [Pyrinomonadaceae bacterium]
MRTYSGKFIFSTLLLSLFLLGSLSVAAQNQEQVATVTKSPSSNASSANVPVFTDYRGIKIGMSADEVRSKLQNLKKDTGQDFYTFSEKESAQIYYDSKGKVTAISIDYFGDNSNAPLPDAVLGTSLQAKADGSMYQLKRYPDAGFWVSYNRTAGDKPIVTITVQKM